MKLAFLNTSFVYIYTYKYRQTDGRMDGRIDSLFYSSLVALFLVDWLVL